MFNRMGNLRRTARKLLQPSFRLLGIRKYCRMGLNGIDRKLEPYLSFKNGVYLEAGANDGIKQSNTYYLEAVLGWKGILVEPVPSLYKKCLRQRPRAFVVNAALVAQDYDQEMVPLDFADLMTSVSSGNDHYSESRIEKAVDAQKLDSSFKFEAKAETLSAIIDRSGFSKIDFLSLDLEGYEPQALAGLDLLKHKPTYILVEVREIEKVQAILGDTYKFHAEITNTGGYRDILFKLK